MILKFLILLFFKKKYVTSLLNDTYFSVGWVSGDESILTSLLRIQILRAACNYGLLDCIAHSKEAFSNFMCMKKKKVHQFSSN